MPLKMKQKESERYEKFIANPNFPSDFLCESLKCKKCFIDVRAISRTEIETKTEIREFAVFNNLLSESLFAWKKFFNTYFTSRFPLWDGNRREYR